MYIVFSYLWILLRLQINLQGIHLLVNISPLGLASVTRYYVCSLACSISHRPGWHRVMLCVHICSCISLSYVSFMTSTSVPAVCPCCCYSFTENCQLISEFCLVFASFVDAVSTTPRYLRAQCDPIQCFTCLNTWLMSCIGFMFYDFSQLSGDKRLNLRLTWCFQCAGHILYASAFFWVYLPSSLF